MADYAFEAEGQAGGLGWLVDPQAPQAHWEVLARPEFVVPITGSGISVPLGYPAGKALASELAKIGKAAGLAASDLTFSDPRLVSDVLIARGVIGRDDLLSRVGELYAQRPSGVSAAIDGLVQVRSRRVVTLNYDCSLEARAAELGIECEPLVLARDTTRVLEVLGAEADKNKLVVIHAHGVATEPSTIVLDGQGYSDLVGAPYVEDCFRLLIFNNRLLFMGTQLDELHILQELIRLRFLHKRHLLVASQTAAGELLQAVPPTEVVNG